MAMTPYDVIMASRAKKQLRDIPLPWKVRIQRTIDMLSKDPFLGEKMRGEFEGVYKVYVWPYRIFYRVEQKARRIEITGVKHRGSAGYK